ncbi:putative alpha-methylacyl-CoA racemase domain protein [Acinetobacter baumannii 754286]|nr:putative alpha-methylacyl-CoA racemase domain protein [Acinetobacter baumannii 754286]
MTLSTTAPKIKAKTFKEWHEIFANLDVCVEPVLSLSEALNSPLAQQRGWIVNVPLQNNTPDTEPQIACPIKFSRSQMRYSFVGQKLGEGQW